MSGEFWYDVFSFSSSSEYFQILFLISSLNHELFRSLLMISKDLGDFETIFLLLISCLIPFWPQNMLYIIWILSNSFRSVSWPRIWSILVNVLYVLEKNVRSAVVWWSVVKVTVRSNCWLVRGYFKKFLEGGIKS